MSRPRAFSRRSACSVLASAGAGALLHARSASQPPPVQSATPVFGYEVVNTYPHDPDAFTQGLIYWDGFLFESTGLNGRSSLRRVRLETGEVVQRIAIGRRYFAEGLTGWGSTLIQL